VGEHDEPPAKRGSRAPLLDSQTREILGSVLRTQDGVRPVFVSIGHRIDLKEAERTVLDCAIRYRLPEPARLADQRVRREKRRLRRVVS
jgi:deoxyribonuclease V